MTRDIQTRRLRWLLWIMLAWVGAIFGRLVWLQVIHHDDLAKLAQQQQQKMVEIPALRGTIFDRSGQPLAKTLPAESICVNPQKIPDPGVAADLLSRLLGLDRARILDRIVAAKKRGSGFLWVKRKVSEEEAGRIRGLKLEWIEFREEMRRFYPHGELASQVVGSTGYINDTDDEPHGNGGIELEFDKDLSGQTGLARVYTDVKQNAYDSVVDRKPVPGADVTLTIDPNLQYVAESALDKAMASSGAHSGSVVVLNPYTGDVLAMANAPRFDPNVPPKPGDPPGARNNLAITTPFEPGSVFKVITLSAALQTTGLTPQTMINCGFGSINLFGRVIHDEHRYGALTMADVLAHSSNIGAINIALKVGDQNLYKYQRLFGFGQKTGIELPGESSGVLRPVDKWMPSSIGSLAMGHEVSATSIQLAVAGAVIANGGLHVKPRIVLSRKRPGDPIERFAPARLERILRPETAFRMRQMMEGVVLHGTGRRAQLDGYTSAGKTGSAQIFDFKAHAYTHHYNASFVGFAPVTNPQIVIAVTLEGTSGGTAGFGGPVAAPVFRDVAMAALRMLDVPKDLPDGTVRASSEPADENDLSIAGLDGPPQVLEPPDGSRSVSSVTPPPVPADAPVSPDASASLQAHALREEGRDRRPFFPASAGGASASIASGGTAPGGLASSGVAPVGLAGPTVPDFRGMTLRTVLEQSSAEGLAVEVAGNGVARSQNPPPGTRLTPHELVRIQFGR